jgi:hypothetical protein
MGIQRLRLASPPAKLLRSPIDFVELSRSRNPPRPPERQRGLWSFLTWPFILAPIAAADAFLPHSGHANPDDQDDSSASQKHATTPAPPDVLASAAPAGVNEQPPGDANDVSRFVEASRGISHDGNHPEGNHAAPLSGGAEAANSSAGGGGGGGGGGPDDSSETQSLSDDTTSSQSSGDTQLQHTSGQSAGLDDISKVGQPDASVMSALDHVAPLIGTVAGDLGSGLSPIVSAATDDISKLGTVASSALDHVAPLIGTVTGELGSGLSTIASATTEEISKVPLGTVTSSALDHVEPLIGTVTGELGSGLSTIVSTTTDEISKVPLGTVTSSALDHVEPLIGAVTGDLGAAPLDIKNGTAISSPDAGDTPINLKDVIGFDLHVSPSSGDVATEATLAPPGTSLAHSMGDLGFVASASSVDSGSVVSPGISHEVDDLFAVDHNPPDLPNSGNATSSIQMGLAKAGAPPVELGIEGVSGGGAEGTTLDAAPIVHAVGEATDVTPGHSLEFSTSPSSAGDALFQGTKYTDYHMALQNGGLLHGTTSESVSTPTITTLPSEPTVLTHADSSAVTQPPEQAAPEHQSLTTSVHSLTVHIH